MRHDSEGRTLQNPGPVDLVREALGFSCPEFCLRKLLRAMRVIELIVANRHLHLGHAIGQGM
jgi:hypothetical protein